MGKFIDAIRGHWVAIVFAIGVGILSVVPTVIAPLTIGSEYKGIQYLYLNDETTYRTRIHEILDGHHTVASPFLYEYKSGTAVVPPINEYVYAIPALLIGLSGAIVFAKFLFPALLFGLVYILVFELLQRSAVRTGKSAAIAAGAVVTLGYDLLDVHLLASLFSGDARSHLLIWTRVVNPIVGVLVSFASIVISWRIFSGRMGKMGVMLAVPLALSVGYFFSFGVSYTFVGLLVLIALLRREYSTAAIFSFAILCSLLLDLSYWYHMLSSMGGEEGRALSLKNGMYFTHQIVINKIILLTTLGTGLLYVYQRIKNKSDLAVMEREWVFIATLIATSWIVFNQQLITGRTVWVDHFVQFTIPISIVVLFVSGAIVLSVRIPRIWACGVYLATTLSVCFGIYSAVSFRHDATDYIRQQQSYGPVVEWLNEHAQDDCVVLSREWNEEFERLLPGYTSCNVYNTQYAYSLEFKDRVLHNFLIRLRLMGITAEDATSYLYAHENEVRGYFFENWDQMAMRTQGRDEWLKSKVEFLAAAYKQSLTTPLDVQIRKYRIDYLVAMQPLSPELLQEISRVRIASTTTQFVIYEIGR